MQRDRKYYLTVILLLCLYKILLGLMYSQVISIEFTYDGFTHEKSTLKMIEGWIVYAVILIAIPKRIIKPSDLFVLLTVLVYIAPLTVYYSQTSAKAAHYYIVLVGFFIINIFRNGRLIVLKKINVPSKFLDIALWSCVILVLFGMYTSGVISNFNLDLNAVYDYRDEASELIDRGGLAYLNNWVYNTIAPSILAISIWRKSVVNAAIIVLLMVILFGLSTHKAILLYPLVVIFVYVWASYALDVKKLITVFILVLLIPYISYHYLHEIILSDLLIRRIFFVPAFLTFKYYEYFSASDFVYWAQSIGGLFVDYELSDTPAKIIGYYIGGFGSANNSFFSAGYMHAGLMGVIIYSMLVSFVFKIIDGYMKSDIPFKIILSITIVPVMILVTSSDLTTSLMTHGLMLSLVILYLMDSSKIFRKMKQF
jgi:hypothetical protein